MFKFLGRSPETVGLSAVPTLQNVSEKSDRELTDPANLCEEDWVQLDSILSAWLGGFQQAQLSPEIPQQPPVNSSPASELPSSVVSATLSPHQHQQVSSAVSQGLAQWLQKVEGFNQTSDLNQSELVQELTKFLDILQSQGKLNSFEVPKNIVSKIQMILDDLTSEKEVGVRIPFKDQTHKNESLFADKKQESSVNPKPRLSLDKNQVILSFIPNQNIDVHEEKKSIQEPLPAQVENSNKSNGLTSIVNHQLPGPDGWNAVKTATPTPIPTPVFTVSEFVPEASDWIGRFMRIEDGHLGSTEAKFSLYPEHLGHIEIKITSQQGQVSAQIVTDTPMAKEALEGQLQHLRQALQQQGLQVQKLDIVQQTPITLDSNQTNLSFSQGGSNFSHEHQTFASGQDVIKKNKKADQTEIESEIISNSYGGAATRASSKIDFIA
ncbi:flagellar hook-length control protein FliK [Bacillus sp. AFS073361]|uniref:flagellar hook-length control protein FliK n=1 Tax=Bacillus sp. AFS073361 TaxID=2033511 RepID=UPI0015D48C76|nr:flagellar hook-length control protein FliK [Bacillus sp. AFS073361]